MPIDPSPADSNIRDGELSTRFDVVPAPGTPRRDTVINPGFELSSLEPAGAKIGMTRRLFRRLVPVRIRYEIRSRLLASTSLAALVTLIDPRLRNGSRVSRHTQLVIEGFPRSANSYAVAAFRTANPCRSTASHAHTFASVMRARRLGVPAILLIRHPSEVAASCLRYEPEVHPAQALRSYTRMYSKAVKHRSAYVLATFDETTRDFGSVLRRCNETFGSDFVLYGGAPVDEAQVARLVDVWATTPGATAPPVHRMGRPAQQAAAVGSVSSALDEEACAELVRAELVYERLTRLARG